VSPGLDRAIRNVFHGIPQDNSALRARVKLHHPGITDAEINRELESWGELRPDWIRVQQR